MAPIFDPTALLGLDFYGFLLPWIFSFAIVFGLLGKLNIFDSGNKKHINMALSFVIAFFVTAVGGPQLAAFFTSLFGGAATYLAGILVLLLFLAMVGKEGVLSEGKYVIILIIIGVLLFLASSSYFGVAYFSAYASSVIFWLIVIILAVYLITKEEQEKKPKPPAGG
ncbi:MAG: hypothetical protein HY513_00560 [Candidatus Aenigmarchaeota archaeon]|nr:hypothetical protein [Candidatus Aenigmarchaeota archaeon]